MPFLALFFVGFAYVGVLSLWQGGVGVAARRFLARLLPLSARGVPVVPPPAFPVLGAARVGDGVGRATERGLRVVTSPPPASGAPTALS